MSMQQNGVVTETAEFACRPLPYAARRTLGARLAPGGIDVAVPSWHATLVQLCLFDAAGLERRIDLFGPDEGVWHAHIPGITAGQPYGFRAHGPWQPNLGQLFNPAKLLLDPYGQGLVGTAQPNVRQISQLLSDPPENPSVWWPDCHDSAPQMARSVIVDQGFDWGGVSRPQVPWERTVIYEAHVRGLTMQHPDIPEELRGTYAGLAHPVTIAHLLQLGVTTVELLPIHASMTEMSLAERGLTNYWGYSTLSYFAPNPALASAAAQAGGPQAVINEVKGMIRLLHQAGLEVVLDVVYNHTCEGGPSGPTVCWRGLDNYTWYRLAPGNPVAYQDFTGCANSLDFASPEVVAMALESLRHWARHYQVDGFRYDLAVTLGRQRPGFDANHPFFQGLLTDPELRGLKHIAEPWDVGPDGWQTGSFPMPMAAWNDRFRDDVRSFWLSNPSGQQRGWSGVSARDLATRLAGSADLFGSANPWHSQGPLGSINYVTAHDGFTLTDLVTYEQKHNLANGENNRDGTDNNRSWNHGVEGPVTAVASTKLQNVELLRRRSERNLFATLVLAGGLPMITAGDEMGRSQGGNNNAYCQDSPVSWVNWLLAPWQQNRLATAQFLLSLRAQHPALRPTSFASGKPSDDGLADLSWHDPAGQAVRPEEWNNPAFRCLQVFRRGPNSADRHALLLINGRNDPVTFWLAEGAAVWELVWDSTWEHPTEPTTTLPAGSRPRLAQPAEQLTLDGLTMRLYLSQ